MSWLDDEMNRGDFHGRANAVFESITLRFGFHPTVFGADRHGSYVWEATERDELARTVTVSLTADGDHVLVEGWAIAGDDVGHFHRTSGGQHQLKGKELRSFLNPQSGDVSLRDMTADAIEQARSIKSEDLDESYSLVGGLGRAPRGDEDLRN